MKEQSLRRVITPILESCGLECEAVEIVPAGRRSIVRVIVDGDGPAGKGPSLDEIAAASSLLSQALDTAAEVGSKPYTLEVTSRGVSRPLTRPAHWRRNIGRLVTIDFTADRSPVTGRIDEVSDDEISLITEHGDETVQLANVGKAVIQVELKRSASTDQQDVPEEE